MIVISNKLIAVDIVRTSRQSQYDREFLDKHSIGAKGRTILCYDRSINNHKG